MGRVVRDPSSVKDRSRAGADERGANASAAFPCRHVDADLPQILVIPCINPHGYMHGTRANAGGQDINRSMDETGIPIVDLLKAALDGPRFDLALDLHEDYDGEGFYLYESQDQPARFGPSIIEAVKRIGPVDCQVNEDDIPLSEGVMAINPEWGTVGWSSYVSIRNASHTIIAETASARPMAERLGIHACVVGEALRLLKSG